MKKLSESIAFTLVFVLSGCQGRTKDDAVARAVLARLQDRDSIVATYLDPSSEISRVPMPRLLREAQQRLPASPVDSVALDVWETINDTFGANRKLSYRVMRGDSVTTAELWLTSRSGKTLVNTLRLSGPVLRR